MFSNDVTMGVTFGPFRLDLGARLLYCDDLEVPLGTRALDVLCVLAEKPGELVTKDELIARAWHGLVVEEHNIQVQVWMLRKALGDAEGRRFIVTVPGRGYRLAHAGGRRRQARLQLRPHRMSVPRSRCCPSST